MRFKSCLGIIFLAALSFHCAAQATQHPTPVSPRDDANPSISDPDEMRAHITSEMAKKAAKERVAALKTDTDKLLKLSVELKSFVDKSDENVLSVDVIRKAEEIEKLAKSVRDKMKGPN